MAWCCAELDKHMDEPHGAGFYFSQGLGAAMATPLVVMSVNAEIIGI
jgi:hypothetical protein